jgi:hypothetical protein
VPASVTRRLPCNGAKTSEKAPPVSLVTVWSPIVTVTALRGCPPFVAATRPLTVAVVGAGGGGGGVGVTIGAGVGVGVVGVELPQPAAIRASAETRCRIFIDGRAPSSSPRPRLAYFLPPLWPWSVSDRTKTLIGTFPDVGYVLARPLGDTNVGHRQIKQRIAGPTDACIQWI